MAARKAHQLALPTADSRIARSLSRRESDNIMRAFLTALILLFIEIPCFATKPVSIAELEQALTTLQSKQDADVAWKLAQLELTERLGARGLARLQAGLPGPKSQEALRILATESEFQAPPAAEIPSGAPGLADQKQIMGLAATYVRDAIPQLPNFLATRETTHFEDTPQLQLPGRFFEPYQPLHLIDSTKDGVAYRNGTEVVETAVTRKKTPTPEGLDTAGIFGPILGRVLVDAAQSSLSWSRWEQGPYGLEAVFRFAVPKEKSHYALDYCCVTEESATVVANLHPLHQIVGYHGEMTIDAAQGTVLRIVVIANLKPGNPVAQSAILVDYGPVEIGAKTYTCPVRSVSRVLARTYQVNPVYEFALANQPEPFKLLLNDTAFRDYHVFRSESRVLTGEEAKAVSPVPTGEAQALASIETAEPQAVAEPASTGTKAEPAMTDAAAQPAAEPAKEAAVAKPEPPEPEISTTAAEGLPDLRTQPSPTGSEFTLRTVSRLVDVAVVAYDKHGRPITDLRPEDFELYDNGRKRPVHFFSTAGERQETAQAPASRESSPIAFANSSFAAGNSAHTTQSESDTTVLMIDAANLAWSDLSYARREMLRFLKSLPNDERVGLYILRSYTFQVLLEPTQDHAQLATELTLWIPNAQDLARAQDEEQRNRQQFDWVHSMSDLTYVNGNGSLDPTALMGAPKGGPNPALAHPVDAELRDLGSNPEAGALYLLPSVARHLAALPGHKNLVWVASDNVLADWSSQTLHAEKTAKFLDTPFLRAQETLNEAQVSIYPLDASQLEVGATGADIRNRNVNAIGFTSRSQGDFSTGPVPGLSPGRDIARLQQDVHGIQRGFRELAEATGGRALRRAGDIAAELNQVIEDGRAAYLLSFTPDTPPDNLYHHLTVTIVGRKDVVLHYRAGYEYTKEPATMRDRFLEAVWWPAEINEIGVSASPESAQQGATLKIRIAATDLALAEQDGRWLDKLDLFLVQRDDAVFHANVSGSSVALQLRPATYQQSLRDGLTLDEALPAMTGGGALRVVVIDENSGRMGTVTIPASALPSKSAANWDRR